MRNSLAAAVVTLLSCAATDARAALTDSEKAVVRTFVKKGSLETAPRVRALVARPDLSPGEIAAPLRAGYADAPFDDVHVRFTDALLFGPGSAAARNSLVPAVVEGLLARAESKMSDVPIEAGSHVGPKERAAVDEVLAIHAFVDRRIANAGSPPPDGHDGSMAIRDDALSAVTRLYLAHLAAHERWLRAPGAVASELARVRVQIALAAIDVARGVVGRHEMAGALGLDGARQGLFERSAVFVEAGGAPEARVEGAIRWLEGVPHAAEGVSAWLLSKASPLGLVGRGKVVRAGIVLSSAPRRAPGGALWPDEVKPSAPDQGFVGVLASVAELATARALRADTVLRGRARSAALHAARAGEMGYLAKVALDMPLAGAAGLPAEPPSGDRVVAACVELLLLDAARATELAVIRESEGRPEPAEQLALALSVLVSDASRASAGHTLDDGAVEVVPITDIKREGGLVSEVKLGARRITVTGDEDSVFTVAVDGEKPKLTALSTFHERAVEAETWESEGVPYRRLFGAPRAVALDDGRFVVEGSPAGFDALATGSIASDVEISALIRPTGDGGGLVARATAGDSSYSGIALLLEPGDEHLRLLVMDGHGRGRPLADPVKLAAPPPDGYVVSLKVTGDQVVAKVGAQTVSGKLTSGPAEGHVGLTVRAKARLDVRKFKVKVKGTP